MAASPPSTPTKKLAALRAPLAIVLAVALVGAGIVLSSVYLATQHTVVLEVNGLAAFQHRTHQSTAHGVLREMGVVIAPEDRLLAPSISELRQGAHIVLNAARTVLVLHDNVLEPVTGHATTVAEVLAAAEVVSQPHDVLTLGDALCTVDTPLPAPDVRSARDARSLLAAIRRPIQVTLTRATRYSVQEGDMQSELYTTAQTVGEALYAQGVTLYEDDLVQPGLSSRLYPGLVVRIERSLPVTLELGGEGRLLRTRLATVRELLAAEGVTLGPKDYILPDPRAALERDLRVQVVRVEDAYYIEEVPIPFEIRYEPDAEMEIDISDVAVWGVEGAHRRRMRVRYENGHELYRVEEEDWIAREARDRIISYGTQIVLRELETPEGTITYWRHLRMLATSYNAATSGTPLDAAWYGHTRLGEAARKGIIAVDPRVIPLRQGMYVPGYGTGYAGDTGSAIKWRRIDLCYDDDNLVLWRKWVDVYLLAPAPDANSILWLIPNTPAEKG
jgi:uncharacterized protein YabE (DUF348 family)